MTTINIYSKCFNASENKTISVSEVIKIIKSKELKKHTDYLRQEKDKDKRSEYKKNNLPAVTLQGTFSYRKNDKLRQASGLATLDIDDYSGDIQSIKEELKKDPHVFCLFDSPSGGLKVIVKIPLVKDDTEYKGIYEGLLSHYSKYSPKGDISNKDVSRLCFLSHDPDIYVNEKAERYPREMLKDMPKKPANQHTAFTQDGEKQKDNSRSGQEINKVIKLISQGFTKEEIFEEMKDSEKWKAAPRGYKDLTYKKAKLYVKDKKKKKEKEKKNTRHTSSYVDKQKKILIEQAYNKKNIFFRYDFNKEEMSTIEKFKVDDITYLPHNGEEIEKKAVLLPSKPLDFFDEDQLDKEILEFINTYLDIPEDTQQFALWNIKRSWIFDRFHTLSYLRALGDTGLGKTRFLDTLGVLHYKPLFIGGATTSAPIFRAIEKWRPTVVIDEADFDKSDESKDIIKIINLGYEKGKSLMRCEKNNHDKINFFDPFCPKVIATRKPFDDKAVESRCITTTMRGTLRKDIPRNLNQEFFDKALQIRNKLLMWRFKNYFIVDPEKKIELEGIEPRVEQIVSNFGTLFANSPEKIEFFKRFVKRKQEDLIEERQNSVQGQIVGVIHSFIYDGICNISNKDILEKEDIFDDASKKLTARGLTSYLKELGFGKNQSKRVDGCSKRCLPLKQDHFDDLCKRYGYDVTVVTVHTVSEEVISDPENLTKYSSKKNSLSQRNNRNNRNTVTEKNIEKWDEKAKVWHPCKYQLDKSKICGDSPTNEYKGQHYCKDHFLEVQK